MTEKALIDIEERKIEETNTSEITYQTADYEAEKQSLTGVGFTLIREAETYTLYQRDNTLALLIDTWVIQGSAEYIIYQLTETFNLDPDSDTDMWDTLLDFVKTEGI